MKKNKKTYLLILLVFGALLTACAPGADPGAEKLEAYVEQPEEPYDAPGFDGQVFNISMIAESKDNRGILDSIESEWVGTFTITPEGEINGHGSVLYAATIFSVDEDDCGYKWVEDGGFDYPIIGKVHQAGDVITIPFIIDNSQSEISANRLPPEATCADPGEWMLDTPEMYFTLHRDILIDDVLLGLHSKLGKQIRVNEALEGNVGKISYSILVDLAAVPLTD